MPEKVPNRAPAKVKSQPTGGERVDYFGRESLVYFGRERVVHFGRESMVYFGRELTRVRPSIATDNFVGLLPNQRDAPHPTRQPSSRKQLAPVLHLPRPHFARTVIK